MDGSAVNHWLNITSFTHTSIEAQAHFNNWSNSTHYWDAIFPWQISFSEASRDSPSKMSNVLWRNLPHYKYIQNNNE